MFGTCLVTRLREEKRSEVARKCWVEMKERLKKNKVEERWKKRGGSFFERMGVKREEVVKRMEELEEGEMWYGQI